MARTHAPAHQRASRRRQAPPAPAGARSHPVAVAQVREVLHHPRLQPKLVVGAPDDAQPAPFAITERPDAGWLRGWLVEGEVPVSEVLEVVNRSPEGLVPVPLAPAAEKLLLFDHDRAPLGFVRLVRDESGRALVPARPGEPVLVLGVAGKESPETARPFMVRENAGRISLRIGQLTPWQRHDVKLSFKPLGKPAVPVTDVSFLDTTGGFLSFPSRFREPGTYRFEVQDPEGKRLKSKGVYSHGARREEMAGVEAAARRYAPVLSQAPEDAQVPVAPEDQLGGLNPSEPVFFEPGDGTRVKYTAEQLIQALRFEGGGTVLPSGANTGLRWNLPRVEAAALTYVIVPDADDRDLVHVSYELFYRYDTKSGTRRNPGIAAHPFDAEGIIVTMKRSGGEWKPVVVIYRHHLEMQTMGMYGLAHERQTTDEAGRPITLSVQDIVHTWEHGAVKVPYEQTVRTPDGRPAVFLSRAHAPYPYPGRKGEGGYRVMAHLGIPIRPATPFEHAGGGLLLAPPEAGIPGAVHYALRPREAAETTEGIAAALSGKRGKVPGTSFSLAKTPEEIAVYVREAEPMATSRVPPEVRDAGQRIIKAGVMTEPAPDDTAAVPTWGTLPAHAQAALAPPGFDAAWFASQPEMIRLSVLNLYVKLKAVGLWHFVARNAGSDSQSLTFRATDVHELKRALRARRDFTDADPGQPWQSREYQTKGQLHFKSFAGWPEDRVQAHIDGRGLLPSREDLIGTAVGTLGLVFPFQALSHRIEYDVYQNPYLVRDVLLGQGFDRATLEGPERRSQTP